MKPLGVRVGQSEGLSWLNAANEKRIWWACSMAASLTKSAKTEVDTTWACHYQRDQDLEYGGYVKCDNVFRQSQLFILTQNLFESVILPLKDYYCWCMWRLHRNLTQNYFKNIEVGWKNWIYGDSSVTDLWVRLIDHIILASIFDSEPSFLYFVRILFKFSNNKYIIHAYWIVSASSNLERWRGNMGLIFCWNTCMEERNGRSSKIWRTLFITVKHVIKHLNCSVNITFWPYL